MPKDRADYYNLADHNLVDVVIDWREFEGKTESHTGTGFYTESYMNTGMAQVTRKDFKGKISTLAVADAQGDIPIERNLVVSTFCLKLPLSFT